MGVVVNLAQAQRWNGESGRNWIAHRERQQLIREPLIPHLLRAAAIRAGERVLDVGCGCGETTIMAAPAAASPGVGGGGAVGLDLSEPMLAVARRLAAAAGVTNVDFVAGDAQVHPLPSAYYDVLISSFGVMFFDDPAAAFTRIVAALRPDGRVALMCWRDDSDNELFGIPWRAVSAHVRLPQPSASDLFTDPGRIAALLTDASCADVQVEPVTESVRVGSDVADVVGYFTGPGRIRRLLAEAGEDAVLDRVRATMAEQFSAYARADGVWVTAAAWLVHARGAGPHGDDTAALPDGQN
jgi:SAM-dependent methyltransferase